MCCSKCGNKNVGQVKYCFKCGATLENKKIKVVEAKETVMDVSVSASNKIKINMNSLKGKLKTLSHKQIGIIVLVVSSILIACVVGIIIYINAPKQKAVSVINRVIENTVITFPDKNLEQIIRDQIKKPTGDILKGDVDKITTLSAPNRNITNILGIENLTKLSQLSLSSNNISNIEPLKGLTNLTKLLLVSNQIKNIESLKELTHLDVLMLKGNQIKDYTPVNSYYKNLYSKDFEVTVNTDYILTNSGTKELKESDLGNFTKRELMLARNEIYARHGFVFNNVNINSYFESKSWYHLDPSYNGDINSIEAFNVKLIKKIEGGNTDNIKSDGLTKQDVISIYE